MLRRLHQAGIVLTLLLALILIVADAGEYPGFSRAAVRAFSRGALPLLVIAGVNLWALRESSLLWIVALSANAVFLGSVLRMLTSHAPPFFWLAGIVAALLVLCSAARLKTRDRRAHP